ncbi:MAG: urea ABC transporter substrate-binding protein [Leptolyngbyaceae cyanobacterium bins.59]|nr:urea ABC transporter substrate-binding protein [Leptolyngbyaceae cyanobacterium bins.59]
MVKVGILHSLTGSMAISESSLRDAALMAIAEINAAGGILGEAIEPVIADGASNPLQFAEQAEGLITTEQVATLFGCWTSASRKAVLPVVETQNRLLWYPVQYEGLECSPNIFYTGSCLNQQVEPAVRWLLRNKGRRFYLVGSDYIFPWTANKLIKASLQSLEGTVVGEEYCNLGEQDFTTLIRHIQETQPDLVFNTLNGDSNLAFYRQYAAAGITAAEIPIMAVSVAEVELQLIGEAATGHYASWSYFQSLDTPSNRHFVEQFKRRYGADRVTSDPIEAAYFQVYLWKQAVEQAQSFESERVREAAYGQVFEAPGGPIRVERNHHVWKPCHIAEALPGGQFQIIYKNNGPLKPLPWLGVEEVSFSNSGVVVQLLSEVSQWIQKGQQLEGALTQLQREMAERQRAETALQESQARLARTQAELEITHRMQKMLLPPEEELQQVVGLDIAGFMEPAEEVGGDYYDVLQHNGRVQIGIGDVTGHGLESGVVMLMVQTAIRTLLTNGETDPVKVLNTVNRTLYDSTRRMRSNKNMTLSLLEYEAGKLRLSGQHEELIIIHPDGLLEQIDTFELGFPLGLESDISSFTAETQIQLQTGDVAVLYTDGITEAMNGDRELYGPERLHRVLQENRQRSAKEIRAAVIKDLRDYIGEQKVFDDITLLVLKEVGTAK